MIDGKDAHTGVLFTCLEITCPSGGTLKTGAAAHGSLFFKVCPEGRVWRNVLYDSPEKGAPFVHFLSIENITKNSNMFIEKYTRLRYI